MTSHRQKKKIIKEGVEKLKRKPGWDPAARVKVNLEDKLRELDQESQNHQTYEASTQCQACLEARQASQDETALCGPHLQEAMGF